MGLVKPMTDSRATVESDAEALSASTWVLTTKRVGDKVAGWVIDSLDEGNVRILKSSERCCVTSFCYPTGAKLVKATLHKID